MTTPFNNEKYILRQSEHIKERIAQFGNKLYLELGGKLFDDFHASRVLPGFQPDSKLTMLTQLRDTSEIVIVISATDIEKIPSWLSSFSKEKDILRVIISFFPSMNSP